LQEVLAHNQWMPCLRVMLAFNDNAKFMNEVHGFFMDSFQVKIVCVSCVLFFLSFETTDDPWVHAFTAGLLILSIPITKAKEKKVHQSPIVSFGN